MWLLGTKWGIIRGFYKGVFWEPLSRWSLNSMMQMCSLDWETSIVCSDPVDSEDSVWSFCPDPWIGWNCRRNYYRQPVFWLLNTALETQKQSRLPGAAAAAAGKFSGNVLCPASALYTLSCDSAMWAILCFMHCALCSWLLWLEPVHFVAARFVSKSIICAMWP